MRWNEIIGESNLHYQLSFEKGFIHAYKGGRPAQPQNGYYMDGYNKGIKCLARDRGDGLIEPGVRQYAHDTWVSHAKEIGLVKEDGYVGVNRLSQNFQNALDKVGEILGIHESMIDKIADKLDQDGIYGRSGSFAGDTARIEQANQAAQPYFSVETDGNTVTFTLQKRA